MVSSGLELAICLCVAIARIRAFAAIAVFAKKRQRCIKLI
jgi:hypothetical protein